MSFEDGDDDIPCLSSETFAALQEFYAEQSKREQIIQDLQNDEDYKENILFDEDWIMAKVKNHINIDNSIVTTHKSPTTNTPNSEEIEFVPMNNIDTAIKHDSTKKVLHATETNSELESPNGIKNRQDMFSNHNLDHAYYCQIPTVPNNNLETVIADDSSDNISHPTVMLSKDVSNTEVESIQSSQWTDVLQAHISTLEIKLKSKSRQIIALQKQLSQFWYDDKTIKSLVKVVERLTPSNGRVCLMCCPTLYRPVKKMLTDRGTVHLLEFDRRFEVYGSSFIHYDYNFPLKLPPDCGQFDLVIVDPPFLAEECLNKTAETIKKLAKNKIILCTGTIMRELAEKLLDVKICDFKPGHRNNLANEFSCYANFDFDDVLKS